MKRTSTGAVGLLLAIAVSTTACDTNASPGPATTDKRGRVDLASPTFSDPTALTNPYFAINEVDQMIQLGAEGPDKLRFEVTLLPVTKIVDWNGQQVETRVHQFVAYGNGRVLEVAEDFYAQDDAGNVWYLGENVDNYKAGVIDNHEGEWLAGRDGTAGMIMPSDPRVGDVYRPENIPGLVFEEVTVKATDQTVDGPLGPVEGAVFIQEELQDGTLEDKIFAPGYGEFRAEVKTEDEVYGAAVAVPVDAVTEPLPDELSTLDSGADRIFGDAGAAQDVAALRSTWTAYQQTEVPARLATQMNDALDALTAARAPDVVRQAALDVRRATLDIVLRYLAPVDVDWSRMDVWAQQVQLDAGAGMESQVLGDTAVLETIWKRVVHTATPAAERTISDTLARLRSAADAGDLSTAVTAASDLRGQLASR